MQRNFLAKSLAQPKHKRRTRTGFLLLFAASLLVFASQHGNAQSYSIVSCNGGTDTTITGTVYDPAGKNPLPNILVYVPQAALSSLSDGVNPSTPVKDSYANLVSGNPLVETTTGSDGTFSLSGVPAGTGVPVVIQAGRWRRQFLIANVSACATTQLYSTAAATVGTDPADLNTSNLTQAGSNTLGSYGEFTSLRFPRNQSEGDIPKIALITGSADALECTMRKVGVDDSEFTDLNIGVHSTSGNTAVSASSPSGRINLFRRNAGPGVYAPSYSGSTVATSSPHTGYDLFSDTATLDGYNVMMLPCAGSADTNLSSTGTDYADAQNVAAFSNAGGRIFATHFSSDLLSSDASISGAANWVSPVSASSNSATATINTASTDSQTMGQWLYDLNGGTLNRVSVNNLRISQTGINSPAVNWASIPNANWNYSGTTITNPVVEFSYYTPFTATSTDSQFGRVFFTDYHVNGSSSGSAVFPAVCTSSMARTAAMSTQEQMLEYSLFQLMNFAIPQFTPDVSMDITTSPATLTAGDSGDDLTVTVTNNSTNQAITLDAPVILTLTLPAGVTATSATGNGWSCAVSGSSVTCNLTSIIPQSASSSFDVTVDIGTSVSGGAASIAASLTSKEFTSNYTTNLTITTRSAVPTTTVLGTSAPPIAYGNSETLTATVSSTSGTPTGSVTFYDGSTALGSGTLDGNGKATYTTSALVVGPHSLTASYTATAPWLTSTSAASSVTVNAAGTTATLAASTATATVGDSVSFTATVSSTSGTPSGTVTFYDGSSVLGAGTLNGSGIATFSTSSLAIGSHNITAAYTAAGSWAASNSNGVSVTINAASTVTTLNASSATASLGANLTFTASVTSSFGTPSGTVTFYDGSNVLGVGTLNGSGVAMVSTSSLTIGSHTITAAYTASSSWAASTSSGIAVRVGTLNTATALTANATSVMYGSTVILTAGAIPSGNAPAPSSAPSGTVTFYDGTTPLGSEALSSGAASLSTSALAVGVHTITAVYSGDAVYSGSASPAITETVLDLSETLSGGSSDGGSSSSSSTTIVASPGGSTSITINLSSNQGTTLPVDSTLIVTGQPSGTTVTLTGDNWKQTATATWVFPKGYTLVSPTLAFKLPSQVAALNKSGLLRNTSPLLLSMLLLPFARRMRRAARAITFVVLTVLTFAGVCGLTGCVGGNGFYAAKSYDVTITLTAGSVTKVSHVTLNVN